MAPSRLNLPNVISLARILACPILFALILSTSWVWLLIGFVLFLAAAISDLWDGYLARKHGWITDTGKLLDPLADKLLLFTTLVPFLIVSHRPGALAEVPWWGVLPIWVVVVIFVREAAVQLFRMWAARKGSVVSAGPSGKIKAFIQNIFSGALILWYALSRLAATRGWQETAIWKAWSVFHGAVVALSLAVALFLTVFSMGIYYWENRRLLHGVRI